MTPHTTDTAASSTRPRPRLLLSELTKLLSLRSVWITALIVAALSILAAWSQAGAIGDALRTNDPALAPGTVPESVGLEWVTLGEIGIIVIGVIAASSEYTSGQLKTSLLASPGRLRLFLAKIAALTILVTGIGIVTVPALSLLSQHGLGDLSVIDGEVPASLLLRWVGAIGYWVAMALIGFSIATLLKQTLIPLFALIVISQLGLMLLLLTTWLAYLPTIAGIQLFDPGLIASYPDAALGIQLAAIVTTGWTIAFLALAGHRFVRRDA